MHSREPTAKGRPGRAPQLVVVGAARGRRLDHLPLRPPRFLRFTTHSIAPRPRSDSTPMAPTRRSETAPRRSSRVTDLEKAQQSAASKAASAAAAKAKKEAAALAREAAKASKQTKKAVNRNVVRPAAKKVAKAAGVDPKDNNKKAAPAPRKPPTDRSKPRAPAKKPAAAAPAKKTANKAAASANKADTKPSAGKTQVGGVVPDMTLRDEDDKEVSLKSLYDAAPLVIFSYPKADTPGCTTQACLYRDSVNEGAFAAVGYTVVGLSRDKPMAQNKWKTKHTLGYTLLSDPEGELLGQLGQTADKKRCHWVIEKGGKLLEAKHGVKPADDAKNALEFIKSLVTAKKDE
ncbi:thioredoxin-like protein [Rhodotorula diobovata]|uniref:thioredoxin-dependent peroxiredoxin n=1 Tax=Rhodotorula diobovata TaxID=5288 RepID=A0A5C5G3L9_9BASI|nr:thioredoxin-like protein [Rhodotorula diobovata]